MSKRSDRLIQLVPPKQDSKESKKGRIALFKLSSGETVIGSIQKEDAYSLYLAYPFTLIKTLEEDTTDGEQFFATRLIEFISDSDMSIIVPLYKNHIISVSVPDDDFKSYYFDYVRDMLEEAEEEKEEEEEDLSVATKLENIKSDEERDAYVDRLIHTSHSSYVDEDSQLSPEYAEQLFTIAKHLKTRNKLH